MRTFLSADAFQKLLCVPDDLVVTDRGMRHMDGQALLPAIGLLPAAQKGGGGVEGCTSLPDNGLPIRR